MTAALNELYTKLTHNMRELEIANSMANEASRTKSEFLSTMSHELRTPLNAIIGFDELLLSGKPGTLTEKQAHQLDRIHSNGLRLLTLIDDVLDLARIEAGRVEIQPVPFVVSDMVEKLTAQSAGLLENKKFKFDITIKPTLDKVVVGDRDRIEHIMLNLLSNAFKFTHQGSVTLVVGLADKPGFWGFSVIDTGIGIPPHAIEYIFEEFRQEDGSSRRVYG